jgi:hypothetical protein
VKRKFFISIARIIVCLGLSGFIAAQAAAQEMPPAPVSVAIIRNLNFGAFSQGTGGGDVILYPTGSRTSTGDIILVNMGYLFYPAKFELQGNPGTIVHFLAGPAATLAGSQGGTMTMSISETDPVTPFILPLSPSGTIEIFIGGILTVGSPQANPPGVYSGSFEVMFIQE